MSVKKKKSETIFQHMKSFINLPIGILIGLVCVLLATDALIVKPQYREWTTVSIISVMTLLSAVLQFLQKRKSEHKQ
jgi:Mg2+-importing ATPase